MKKIIDITGIELAPGRPDVCAGADTCCDECDFLIDCGAVWGDETCIRIKKSRE